MPADVCKHLPAATAGLLEQCASTRSMLSWRSAPCRAACFRKVRVTSAGQLQQSQLVHGKLCQSRQSCCHCRMQAPASCCCCLAGVVHAFTQHAVLEASSLQGNMFRESLSPSSRAVAAVDKAGSHSKVTLPVPKSQQLPPAATAEPEQCAPSCRMLPWRPAACSAACCTLAHTASAAQQWQQQLVPSAGSSTLRTRGPCIRMHAAATAALLERCTPSSGLVCWRTAACRAAS